MKRQLTSKDLTWQIYSEPSPEELAEVVREAGLTATDAEFMAQERQRPEVAVRKEYVFLLIQVPVFEKKERLTRGVSVYCIIHEHAVFTVAFEKLAPLERLVEELGKNLEQQEEYFADGAVSLTMYIIRRLLSSALTKVERLSKHIDIAEDAVFHGNERKMVEEIALLTRDVVDFRRVIRPQRRLFYEVPIHSFITPETQEQWRRMSSQINKLWDILESLAESAKQLGHTNDALLQHKENQLLRLLSIYSIVTIPVFILASPFNTENKGYETLFWIVFMFLLISLAGILLWSKHRKAW